MEIQTKVSVYCTISYPLGGKGPIIVDGVYLQRTFVLWPEVLLCYITCHIHTQNVEAGVFSIPILTLLTAGGV